MAAGRGSISRRPAPSTSAARSTRAARPAVRRGALHPVGESDRHHGQAAGRRAATATRRAARPARSRIVVDGRRQGARGNDPRFAAARASGHAARVPRKAAPRRRCVIDAAARCRSRRHGHRRARRRRDHEGARAAPGAGGAAGRAGAARRRADGADHDRRSACRSSRRAARATRAAAPGGTVTLEPDTGSINVNGARRSTSAAATRPPRPARAACVTGSPRSRSRQRWPARHRRDQSRTAARSPRAARGNGADGGRVDIELKPTDGAVMVDQSAKISADGGGGRSAASRGRRAHLDLHAGRRPHDRGHALGARRRRRDSGKGGLGGMIYFFSDDNHNAVDVGKGKPPDRADGHARRLGRRRRDGRRRAQRRDGLGQRGAVPRGAGEVRDLPQLRRPARRDPQLDGQPRAC